MAQFPINTPQGLYEAVNYLASGPAGLGQNFQGFSSYTPAYLTGNFRLPFTNPVFADLYVPPITCASAVQLDNFTFQFNFSSTQSIPPFVNGMPISSAGWANDFYNGGWGPIGVVFCTVDYVIVKTQNSYPGIGDDLSGGTVFYDGGVGSLNSTDCNARVIVNSGTDRVFISAQLPNIISYTATTSSDIVYRVQVNRYIGFLNNNPVNPDYIFILDSTVSEKTYTFAGLTGTGTLDPIETVFGTVIDQPAPGFYWYILEVQIDVTAGDLHVTQCEFSGANNQNSPRSLSAQVVKQ